MRTLNLILTFSALFILINAATKCEGNKFNKKVKNFHKCLDLGYKSSIDGCTGATEDTMKKSQAKKCTKVEKSLKKCDYTCNKPVHGGWTDFGDWSECSAECGGGSQSRSRICTNPAPQHGGADCQGEDSEKRFCNAQDCPKDYVQKVLKAAWQQIPGRLARISKGIRGVWGVNSNDDIWELTADRKRWVRITGKLVQVSSGASIWGVNSGQNIWKYLGANKWQQISGKLVNVDVSNNDHVWGVNKGQDIWRRTGSSWQQVSGKLIQISVGESGVWGVNAANNIYYRQGTYADADTAGTGWTNVPGKLQWISSGTDLVVGVNSNNDIFYREGISAGTPTGTRWVKVAGKLNQIDVDEDEVVGTNSKDEIWRSPVGPAK